MDLVAKEGGGRASGGRGQGVTLSLLCGEGSRLNLFLTPRGSLACPPLTNSSMRELHRPEWFGLWTPEAIERDSHWPLGDRCQTCHMEVVWLEWADGKQ